MKSSKCRALPNSVPAIFKTNWFKFVINMLIMPSELKFQNTVKNISLGGLKHSTGSTNKTGTPNGPKLFMNSVASKKNPFNIVTGGKKPNTTTEL